MPDDQTMAEKVRRLRGHLILAQDEACAICDELLDYLGQCIADRDRPTPWGCDHDTDAEFTDPFADEGA